MGAPSTAARRAEGGGVKGGRAGEIGQVPFAMFLLLSATQMLN